MQHHADEDEAKPEHAEPPLRQIVYPPFDGRAEQADESAHRTRRGAEQQPERPMDGW